MSESSTFNENPVLNLYQTKRRRVLSSRETARALAPNVRACLSQGNEGASLIVDLAGMATVAPGFVDEFLRVIKDSLPPASDGALVIDVINTPANQFSRFRAVCRVHEMTTEEISPGHWRIS